MDMVEKEWWKKPMRVIQYNLQVRDTPDMDPLKLARETVDLGANVVVINVGGIYAWYPSKVPFHHINEFLPKDRDLLEELITAFHARDIRVVARFDFSIAEDVTYLNKPQWFARDKDLKPCYRGEKRMGNWSLLLNTCALGGYRNEEVAVPVLKEVLRAYEVDGIFLNAPHAGACYCARCRNKYKEYYGKTMPEDPSDFEGDWLSRCMKENIGNMYRGIKEEREDVPLILYYTPFSGKSRSFGRFDRDSLHDRYATADLICTESQNVLSRGVHRLPLDIHPVIAMKSGQIAEREKLPFGIIHSCPGMDWRHVGMPAAEYLPWMSQVPASGGVIWHSVTGFPDTITDKRVLEAIREINHRIRKTEDLMEDARYRSDVLLCWDGSEEGRNWADILVKTHLQFDLIQDYDLDLERMKEYPLAVVPDHFPITDRVRGILSDYVAGGGTMLLETTQASTLSGLSDLLGIEGEVTESEELAASYVRLEADTLKETLRTDRIALKGRVAYCKVNEGGKIYGTLIPPFAPYEVVGAPPERASIPVSSTQIPLLFERARGRGKSIVLTFPVGQLTGDYHLEDHYRLMEYMIGEALGADQRFGFTGPRDVQTTVYEKGDRILIHLVNEVGKRPMTDNILLSDLKLSLKTEGRKVDGVRSVIEENEVCFQERDGVTKIKLKNLRIWDMLEIRLGGV